MSWETQHLDPEQPFFTSVEFKGPKNGWAISRDHLYRTSDGGKNSRVVLRVWDLPKER